jgi:NAD-dependent SIR2 family protein deacetylase
MIKFTLSFNMRYELVPLQLTSAKRNDQLLRGTSAPNLKQEIIAGALELYQPFQTARPNAGHLAITQLETLGKLRGLITQCRK